MKTVVDSMLVEYQQYGDTSSPGLLLLHGWGVDYRNTAGLAELLAENYHVTTPSLAGFGSSQPPETAWDAHDYAESVGKFVGKLDLDVDVLVGHSMGGQIAIAAAANNLVNPQKLCLVATAGIRTPNSARNTMYKLIAKTGKLLLSVFPNNIQRKARRFLYKQAEAADYYQVSSTMKPTLERILADDVSDDASLIKSPTLFVCGTDDQSTPLADVKRLQERVNSSKLEVINGAGHHLHNTNTQAVADAIVKFTERTR